jgi:hypothetical protein
MDRPLTPGMRLLFSPRKNDNRVRDYSTYIYIHSNRIWLRAPQRPIYRMLNRIKTPTHGDRSGPYIYALGHGARLEWMRVAARSGERAGRFRRVRVWGLG